MRAGVDFTNHIDISEQTNVSGLWKTYGYRDLTDEVISQIADAPVIKWVQISRSLPREAYTAIDRILEKREDLVFRIYGLPQVGKFDLSCLHGMKHLKRLTLDCHLRDRQDLLDLSVLTRMENLRALRYIGPCAGRYSGAACGFTEDHLHMQVI